MSLHEVVPETPEAARSRRRSSRLSTTVNSAASDSLRRQSRVFHKVPETPTEEDDEISGHQTKKKRCRGRPRKSILQVEESPDVGVSVHHGASEPDAPRQNLHPLFQPHRLGALESEDTFVQFVAATQDLASTRVEDKVGQWLLKNEEELQTKNSPVVHKRGRRSTYVAPKNRGRLSTKDLCEALYAKEGDLARNAESSERNLSKTPNSLPRKTKRRTSSIFTDHPTPNRLSFVNGALTLSPRKERDVDRSKVAFSSQSTIDTDHRVRRSIANIIETLKCDSDEDDEVFFKDQQKPTAPVGNSDVSTATGFQAPDLSSDSAKALMAEFEKKLNVQNDSAPDTAALNDVSEGAEMLDDDLPPTQPSSNFILDGVVAYVEVRTKHENRSKCVQDELSSIGAKISNKLGTQVTHMVFKDGSLATYNRAKRLGIFIVSVTWIEACKKENRIVSEGLFPSTSKEKYDSPNLFPKLRKAKSMQPKSDEELRRKLEALTKRKGKKDSTLPKSTPEEDDNPIVPTPEPRMRFPIPLDYYNSPRLHDKSAVDVDADKKDSVMNLLNEMRSPAVPKSPSGRLNTSQLSGAESPCTSEDFSTPLGRRLVNKLYRNPSAQKDTSGSQRACTSPLVPRRLEIAALGEIPARSTISCTSPTVHRTLLNGTLVANSNHDHVNISDVSIMSGVAALSNPGGMAIASKRSRGRPRKTFSMSSSENAGVGGIKGRRKRKISAPEADGDSSQREKAKAGVETESLRAQKPITRVKAKRHQLFTQTSLLSETAVKTPIIVPVQNIHSVPSLLPNARLRKPKSKPHTQAFKQPQVEPKSKKTSATKPPIETSSKGKHVFRAPPRKSSIEFVKLKKKSKKGKKPVPTPSHIVCTSCQSEDVDLARQLTRRLGNYRLSTAVSQDTSHVVCGDTRRTLSLLKGTLLGCWIVSKDWLFACLEAEAWVDEEAFEMVAFSQAVRTCRLEKVSFGPVWQGSQLFAKCGAIYFSRKCRARQRELAELAALGSACVVKVSRVANVVVGEEVGDKGEGVMCVDETWFFDCIQQNKLLEAREYKLL